MFGTVTVLTFTSDDAKAAALAAIADLVDAAADLPAVLDVVILDTGPSVAVMVTLYESEESAAAASSSLRTHIGSVVGPHVAGPPQRWAGQIVPPMLLRATGRHQT
jgi:hypothetical protein